ncbi:MAG: hypothetical protein MK135_12930 [Polyangiaceae bacterium]|nr:hypothetical protein [Polyangiaceae bacterium]
MSPPLWTSDSISRRLLALPELGLRIKFFEGHLQGHQLRELSHGINKLIQIAHEGNQRARAALLPFSIYLSRQRDSSLIFGLREEAQHQDLLALESVVRGGVREELPRENILAPVYASQGGRELSVGERKSLARRPSRLELEKLLHDPHPLVLSQLLAAPTLTEEDILVLVTRRPARQAALEAVNANDRWMSRPAVRLAIILNPRTPHGMALPLVLGCQRDDLKLIHQSTTLNPILRQVAQEIYSILPPKRPGEAAPSF